MKRFTIFGSRLLFWLLAPWVIGGLLFFPYLAYQEFLAKETFGFVVGAVLSLWCIIILLVAFSPKRFGWLVLVISGSIGLAYIWYFCDTFFVHHEPIQPSLNTAAATPFNAILGFFVWGVPSWFFTIRGVKKLIDERRKDDA